MQVLTSLLPLTYLKILAKEGKDQLKSSYYVLVIFFNGK